MYARILAASIVALLAGCTGKIGDRVETHGPRGEEPPPPTGAGGSVGMPEGGAGSGVFASCDPNKPVPAPAPLARLTNLELANTLRDLFPTIQVPAPKL